MVAFLTLARIVAMIVGFCWVLLFLFVPETFWDRSPRPKSRGSSKNNSRLSLFRQRVASNAFHISNHFHPHSKPPPVSHQVDGGGDAPLKKTSTVESALRRPSQVHRHPRSLHVGFAPEDHDSSEKTDIQQGLDGHISPPNSHAEPISAAGMSPLIAIAAGKTQELG
jgi:hypothetical protein